MSKAISETHPKQVAPYQVSLAGGIIKTIKIAAQVQNALTWHSNFQQGMIESIKTWATRLRTASSSRPLIAHLVELIDWYLVFQHPTQVASCLANPWRPDQVQE